MLSQMVANMLTYKWKRNEVEKPRRSTGRILIYPSLMEEHYTTNQIQKKRNFKVWQGKVKSNLNHFENWFIKIFHLSGILADTRSG